MIGSSAFRGAANFEVPPPPPPRRSAQPDRFDPFEDRSLFPPPPPPRPQKSHEAGDGDDDDDPERRAFEAELRRVAADLDKVMEIFLMGELNRLRMAVMKTFALKVCLYIFSLCNVYFLHVIFSWG